MAQATISPLRPHTRIDNAIIDKYLPQMGTCGFAIYAVLLRHQNRASQQCTPSYKTIAQKTGLDRSTVIRHLKKLETLGLITPLQRWDSHGDRTSNQYNMTVFVDPPASQTCPRGSRPTERGVVAENHHPPPPGSGTEPPEQIEKREKNKDAPVCAEKTADLPPPVPTAKQQACPHPVSDLYHIDTDLTICNHCYSIMTRAKDAGGTAAPRGTTMAVA